MANRYSPDEPDVPGPVELQPLPSPSPAFYSQPAAALAVSRNQSTAAVPDFDSPLQLRRVRQVEAPPAQFDRAGHQRRA